MSAVPQHESFVAQPPLKLGRGQGPKASRFFWDILRGFYRILVQPLTPFNPRPEEPLNPPKPSRPLDDRIVEQCRRIYDEAEGTRTYLEDKARVTFTLITFLAPLLASALVYVAKDAPTQSPERLVALSLAAAAGLLIVLAFISVARAVSVQSRESLFLGSVIDDDGSDFREYDPAYYARGLLYCASVNAGMNAHIAQFVKGAHVLTTLAVLLSCASAVTLMFVVADSDPKPSSTLIAETVAVSSPQLENINQHLGALVSDLRASLAQSDIAAENFRLKLKLRELQDQLNKINERDSAPRGSLLGEEPGSVAESRKSR